MRERENAGRPVGDAQEDAKQGGGNDSEEDGAVDLTRHKDQRESKAETGGLHGMIGKTPQADVSGGIGDDQLGVAHSDERNEHPDAGGGGVLQAGGNAVDDLLADTGDREYEKH